MWIGLIPYQPAIALMEERITTLEAASDKRFEAVDKRFEQVDKRLDRVQASIDELRKELQRFARWGLGLVVTIAIAAVTLVAKAILG